MNDHDICSIGMYQHGLIDYLQGKRPERGVRYSNTPTHGVGFL